MHIVKGQVFMKKLEIIKQFKINDETPFKFLETLLIEF